MTMTSSLVLDHDREPPEVALHTYRKGEPVGAVRFDGSLTIQSCDPADLRGAAEAFADAARLLTDELDREAARAMSGAQT